MMTAIPARDTRLEGEGLGLRERLALIGLMDEGMRAGDLPDHPGADLFGDLWDLVSATVSGSRLDRLKAEGPHNGFHAIEITGEGGIILGRLNMLYLKKPLPCYYLVYVEVAPPFRRRGLGSRVLEHFGRFLADRNALGILDNIIPEEDPTYGIYAGHGWVCAASLVGRHPLALDRKYMVFVPNALAGRELKIPVLRLLHHLHRKRAAIDMRDNEGMVKRTIEEFKEIYAALLAYFGEAVEAPRPNPAVRFFFTRFVTKLVAFRRRIADLLGYTGGESMDQLVLAPSVLSLKTKSYAPFSTGESPDLHWDDEGLWERLPEAFRTHPARAIEALPNYARPSLHAWLREKGRAPSDPLLIRDILDLGFDPTRLKEAEFEGKTYIFERIQNRQVLEIQEKRACLGDIARRMPEARVHLAELLTNPPLLVLQDRGNAYVLRRKVMGIHFEEALEQIQASPLLKSLDAALDLERILKTTVRRARETIRDFGDTTFAFFVSWDIERNYPVLCVDERGSFFQRVWLA